MGVERVSGVKDLAAGATHVTALGGKVLGLEVARRVVLVAQVLAAQGAAVAAVFLPRQVQGSELVQA